MSDKRIKAATTWAEAVQAISPTPVGLATPAEGVIKAGDLARHTARDLVMPFETEHSAFTKMLHVLAPADDT